MAKTQELSKRKYFTKINDIDVPDLLEHQKRSWREFVQEGLSEIFAEVNPISDYTGAKLDVSFKSYFFGDPKISEREARENNTSFDAPLYANVELINKVTGEVKEQELFMGNYPWMTERATFVINGAERVVVSQLIRSPGVTFARELGASGFLYSAKLAPARGAWIEIETAETGVMYAKIDRRRKLPVTTLLQAFGMTRADIKKAFKDIDEGELKFIDATLEKDAAKGTSEALIEVYRKLRPGDLATVDNARSLIESTFFNFKRFDLSRVGRYKLNSRLNLDVTNEVENRVLRIEDLTEIIKEVIRLNNTGEPADDIDSLSSRRVKLVGELIQRQFRIGMLRIERNIKDRMSLCDIQTVTAAQLVNARPIVASVREFFTTSQLSQFMEQTNPLSELAHKRRLNSMGPGGLTRERAGFEVRDVHPTHYGRICMTETPEGPNIGLVLNLATYARVNDYGFIETPYFKVKGGKITEEIVYLTADQERDSIIASAGNKLNDKNQFVEERVAARKFMQAAEIDTTEVDYMDAAQSQIVGSTAALIPFIEKNLVNRCLMGANMQKQAVPLIKPQPAIIGTGMEELIARNTGQVIVAEGAGEVKKASADKVEVKYKDGTKIYELMHFVRTNSNSSINQKVIAKTGDKVKAGDILAEGMSIKDGELALGKDLLVAFMPWGGYNFEDSMVISQRLVKDDELTSIYISDFITEVRETKLGPEVVTRDIPNVSEEVLANLDESGIVRIGAEVEPGDILVGKITPKGEQELSSEEKLLRAIFGEKAKDVRDTSERMPNGKRGKIVGVKIFTRENGADLKSGVLMQVQVFVAQMRKIQPGDKMAGRYGNKGVVAKILPEEDMPFTEDGTPVDMVLNPLGVPSRMNIGQLFELHLGLAARALGYKVATPAFDGVSTEQVKDELEKAGFARDGKMELYDGRTGEKFKERVAVGVMHMMKLHHMVSDKIHSRSIGPYTMVTQQPLGGKAQNGGQRFGEMEVWALEAYGAASTLQEMLTIKSDDVYGRSKAYEAIIKGEKIVGPKVPESFNVLVKELQGLGMRVDLVGATGLESDAEATLEENIEDEASHMPAEMLIGQDDEDGGSISIAASTDDDSDDDTDENIEEVLILDEQDSESETQNLNSEGEEA
jgi:DNA-directed RNA polymerase subunit beta